LRSVEERLKSYEPLWENWTYTGEFLGEGAMSSVFEIQSTAMGMKEVAALKIITVKKNAHGEIKIPENALNEIKILRTLSGSSNIVNYHDSTQRNIYDDDGNLAEIDILIKMEKLEPLSEGKKLSEDDVINLARDMCTALMHASDHGIIHRDIKPQNIFLDEDGNYKLGDFGISKIVSGLSEQYTMNIGTLAYTAPEVAGSIGGKYDISSDIYSLGLVLYAFLNNGYLPFANSTASLHDAISKRLAGAPFPSPANGSKSLKSIVMRACTNDRVKRFKTPREMLDALDLLSSGGKKMVVDPFATLDANIDITDEAYSTVAKPAPAGEAPLGTDIRATTYDKGISRGGLKINMSKPSPEPVPTPPPVTPAKKTGTLTIRMDKSTPPPADTTKDKPPVKTESECPPPGEPKVSTSDSKAEDISVAADTKKGISTTGSLRINMGGKITTSGTSSTSAEKPKVEETPMTPPTPKTDTTPKTDDKPKSGSSFFSAPKSL